MPFKKTGPNQYTSPSGRKFTKKQVVAYYATDGFTRRVKGTRKGKKVQGKKRSK